MSGEALHKAEEFSVAVRRFRKCLEMLGMVTSHSRCQEDEGWFATLHTLGHLLTEPALRGFFQCESLLDCTAGLLFASDRVKQSDPNIVCSTCITVEDLLCPFSLPSSGCQY